MQILFNTDNSQGLCAFMMKNRGTVAINAHFQFTINRRKNIVAVVANVEAQEGHWLTGPTQCLSSRADANRLRIRPRNVPALCHEEIGPLRRPMCILPVEEQ